MQLARALLVLAALGLACAHSSKEGDGTHTGHHGGHHGGHHAGAAGKSPEAYHHAGGVHHRFDDAEAWAKRFEDPARDEWQKPEAVLDVLQLAPTHIVADIGAATGYFPVRIARRVTEGRVWGVDIEPDMVRFLNARAREEGLANLYSVMGTPDDPLFPERVDLVLTVNTYHHITERTAYFARLAGQLKDGGRIAIVDFKMGDIPVGPPEEGRITAEAVRAELEAAGYQQLLLDTETLPYQYIVVFARAEK